MLFGNNTTNAKAINTVSFVYAHGKLEEALGHDILVSEEPKMFRPGVWTDRVVFDNGEEWPVVVFAWDEGPRRKGLVVWNGDMEGLRYAARCFADQVTMI